MLSEGTDGGGGEIRILQSLWEDKENFVVTKPNSSKFLQTPIFPSPPPPRDDLSLTFNSQDLIGSSPL